MIYLCYPSVYFRMLKSHASAVSGSSSGSSSSTQLCFQSNCQPNPGPKVSRISSRISSRRSHGCQAAKSRDCVVVGGGIGGLVTAAKCAQSGEFRSVTICEQNPVLGGRTQTVTFSGCRFDTGPSLLLLPQVYRDTFRWLQSDISSHVELRRVEPAAYRVWFADGYGSSSGGGCDGGCTLDMLYDVQHMVEQLEQVEEGAGMAYLDWLAGARKALVLGTDNFIARDFSNPAEFLNPGRLLPLLGQLDLGELLLPHWGRLQRRFKSPRIAALLSFQDLYVGLSPYSAPGVFSLLAATEITDGVFYPVGGFGKVIDGVLSICQQAGVQVHTSAAVKAIRSRGGAVTGVELQDGTIIPADTVITNVDVSQSYSLLSDEPRLQAKQQQLAAKEYSAGVIAFYWAVNKRCEQLAHHNVFLSGDYKGSWERAKEPTDFVQHPNFYLCCPARTDPTAAPPDGDSVMVLLPVANIQQRARDADYSSLVAAGRQLIFQTLAAAGVDLQQQHIVQERVREPAEWREMYTLEHGAAFGLSHGLNQLALFRPGCVDPEGPKGLYFVGASSRPGNGVPLVMMGAKLTAERILADAGQH